VKNFVLHYSDGSKLQIYDRVLINNNQVARVEAILFPETVEALQYSCEEGGFLLVFENGDVQVWPDTDEDILLVRRSDKKEKF
jgi:hypothetical protein